MTFLRNLFSLLTARAYFAAGWIRASFLGVRLGRGAMVSPHAQVKGVAYLGCVEIGRRVRIGQGTYVNSGDIASGIIGEYCAIGYGVLIGPTEHRLDYWTMSPFEAVAAGYPASDTTRDVPAPVIGDRVWVGAHAVVLRGVTIGTGAVVAAGAVVVGDIPPYEIWGGVPARRIGIRQPQAAAQSS